MQGVAGRIFGHDFVRDVALNDRLDFRRFSQQRHGLQHGEALGALFPRVAGIFQFLNHGEAGDDVLFWNALIPPFSCPALTRDIGIVFPGVEIEARNSRLDINERAHFSILRPRQLFFKIDNLSSAECGFRIAE